MAANSGVRSGSRSPPFLVIGLCVALCILGFYYWNLSSRNSDLAFEVEQLRASIRVETSKRSKADERTETVLLNLKECENTEQKDKSIISDKENNLKSVADQLHGKEEELNSMKTRSDECVNSLTQCRTDTSGIQDELAKLKEDNKKREDELQALKVAAADKKCDCTAEVNQQRKEIEEILNKAVGPQAVHALNQNGIVKNEPAQVQPPNPAQGQVDQPQKPAVGNQSNAQNHVNPDPNLPNPGHRFDNDSHVTVKAVKDESVIPGAEQINKEPKREKGDPSISPEGTSPSSDKPDHDLKVKGDEKKAGFRVPGFHPQANLPGNPDFHPVNQQPPNMVRSFNQKNDLIKKDAAEEVDGDHGVDAGKAAVDGAGKPLPGGVAAEVKEEAGDVEKVGAVERENNPRYDNEDEDDEEDDGDVVGKKVIEDTKDGGDTGLKFEPKKGDGIDTMQRNMRDE